MCRFFFSLVLIFSLISSCKLDHSKGVRSEIYLNSHISAEKLIDSLKISASDLSILIDKSNYKLSLLSKKRTIKEYPIVLGRNPIDDKRMEGDMSTPEGNFKIRDLYPHKSWSKFIWIDYPTKDSKRKFSESIEKGEIPKNSTIGGEVGIHGAPKNKDYLIYDQNNWTWGCISLTNKDVNDLYKVCFIGMRIKIIH